MALSEEELKGKIQVQSDLVPDGDDSRQPVTSSHYVAGGAQTFQTIDDLVAFHPKKMVKGMSASVVTTDLNSALKVEEYRLMADPTVMYDAQTLVSYVTVDNYLNYWTKSSETSSSFSRVYEYAPDGPNGSKPPFPYEDNLSFEQYWVPVYDPSLSHNWLRYRDDDVDANADGVFDNWTVPLSIRDPISQGDYIENRYARQAVNETIVSNQGQMVITDLPSNNTGWYQVVDESIDEDTGTVVTSYTKGRYFKYVPGNTYTFNNGATAIQTMPPPPRTVGGVSNNDGVYPTSYGLQSIIFTDTVPAGATQLWVIEGQKSVYQALKSDWLIRKIIEDSDLTRYANTFTAEPNALVGTDERADIDPGNTALNDAGWSGTFIPNATYMATRSLTGGSPAYTVWTVTKIKGESGEYKDRVFILLPLNMDYDDRVLLKPVGSDAISEGYSDVPLEETETEINYISETTKYYDGSLKTPWSTLIPYTGQDTFNDIIDSDLGNNFKYDPQSATPDVPDPTEITLVAKLYRGLTELWQNNTITYVWTRVYDDGAIDGTIADNDTGKNFYYLPASGTPGDPAYLRDGQQLVVKPDGVNGRAVFVCEQTLDLGAGGTVVFTEQYVVTDLTDGKDAKDLSVTADAQLVLYDTVATAFNPSEVNINAYTNNLPTGYAIKWFVWTGAAWSEITSGVGGYTITPTLAGSVLNIDIAAAGFPTGNTIHERRFAATTHGSDPDSHDNVTTFTDYITITKSSAAGVGAPGENTVVGILDNEAYNVLLDEDGFVYPGEIGPTGKASTLLQVYDGGTKISFGAGAGTYQIGLASDNPGVFFASVAEGSDVRVYCTGWQADERQAKCTITITYQTGDARGNVVFTKIFAVNSTIDPTGAINLIIASQDGRFNFYPDNRTDITLIAELYNDQKVPSLQDPADYYYSWKVGTGTWSSVTAGGGGTNGDILTVTRDEIRSSGQIDLRIFHVAVPSIPNDIFRSASVRLSDIVDGKTYRLYQDSATKPTKPAATVGPAGNGTWVPDVPASWTSLWAVDGTEKDHVDWGDPGIPEYDWSDPYQIGGEKGDQGDQGGGMYPLYASTNIGFPGGTGNTSTLDQMITHGWLTRRPATDEMWMTERLFYGVTATGSPVTLDANGKLVGEDASDAVPFPNSQWQQPTQINGIDGDPGADAPATFPNWRGLWSNTDTYAISDVVRYPQRNNGRHYIAKVAISSGQGHPQINSDWQEMLDARIVPFYDGIYSVSKTYFKGAIVEYLGDWYMYWNQSSEAGWNPLADSAYWRTWMPIPVYQYWDAGQMTFSLGNGSNNMRMRKSVNNDVYIMGSVGIDVGMWNGNTYLSSVIPEWNNGRAFNHLRSTLILPGQIETRVQGQEIRFDLRIISSGQLQVKYYGGVPDRTMVMYIDFIYHIWGNII
jgi:hypothetical protein